LQRRIQTVCRGRFLELEPQLPWTLRPAADLLQRLVHACVSLAEYWDQWGVHKQAVEACQSALRFDPLAENLHRRLMRLHADHGNVAEAVLAYKHCKRVLSLHLGVPPSRATNDLYRSLQEPVAAARFT
jgi:DNA-binding SARP family transcriptional activator